MKFRRKQVHDSVFVAENATICGDVTISEASSIWFNAVIRGDADAICIGERTNVQDLCLLHADPGFPCVLGNRVTVGHGAIVHGATVEDDVVIGMRAVILNGARIGTGSIVAAGAIVTEGTEIPANSLAMGIPAKVKRETTREDHEKIQHGAEHYAQLAQQYKTGGQGG